MVFETTLEYSLEIISLLLLLTQLILTKQVGSILFLSGMNLYMITKRIGIWLLILGGIMFTIGMDISVMTP